MMTLLATLLACSMEQAPPPEPEPPACTLSSDSLAGRHFVRETRSADATKDVPDNWARMQFAEEGGKLSVLYNSRSPFDMYTYDCKKGKSDWTCRARNTDLQQWCQTLIANKGQCSAAELADLTGAPIAEATKAQEELMAKVKKLKPDELDAMKRAFSQPNNQLRGMLKFRINTKSCKLNVTDTYQTMTEGQLREVENYVGNSAFVESTEDLSFDHCKDLASLVALTAPDAAAQPGQTKVKWNANESVPFRWVGELQKPEGGCTYSMDVYDEFLRVEKGKQVNLRQDGSLDWSFDRKYSEKGRKIVQMTRYKSCNGGQAERVDVGCAMVEVAE
ncbi:MAG: hypothetical protein H6738_09320 [Alphaproteobacteria bacterium]|nr:hypothetical protein [Alphaproteobacteria bacterium]